MFPHIPELDGVRGIAILCVLILHFYDPVMNARPFGWLTHVIQRGGAGVDLFFVLSGFLITGILVSSRNTLNYFRAFYARRALRIFPLYIVVTAFFFWIAVPFLQHHGKDMWIRPQEQVWYWLFLANWRHALGYNDGAQLAHFWSLAIEEQFYLVWSVLVWLMGGPAIRRLSLLLVVLVTVLRIYLGMHGVSGDFLYFSTVTRLDDLAMGSLLALSMPVRQFLARYAVVLLPCAFVLSMFDLPGSLNYAVFAIGSGALVALASTRPVPLLRNHWLRTLGKYSYGLYVLHYLIHGVAALVAPRFPPLPFAVASIVGGSLLSFAAAWISWRVLENPCLRLKRYVPYRFAEDGKQS